MIRDPSSRARPLGAARRRRRPARSPSPAAAPRPPGLRRRRSRPRKTFQLVGFRPAGPVVAGRPTRLAFTIRQPSGAPLTRFQRGTGAAHRRAPDRRPRRPLRDHPPPSADRARTAASASRSRFPAPGRYRVVIDVYPKLTGPQRNFQLFRDDHRRRRVPPAAAAGLRADRHRRRLPLHAARAARGCARSQPAFLTITVRRPNGTPARFTPWFGALAHAIFFRAGSLDYFHTHVCSPGASGCTSTLGASKITGSSTARREADRRRARPRRRHLATVPAVRSTAASDRPRSP